MFFDCVHYIINFSIFKGKIKNIQKSFKIEREWKTPRTAPRCDAVRGVACFDVILDFLIVIYS